MSSYHLQFFGPLKNEHVDWPDGSVSVYQIDGDQIADRIVRAEIVKPERGPAYYGGEVIARHSWCGYIGSFETLAEAATAIEKDREEKKKAAAVQAARKALDTDPDLVMGRKFLAAVNGRRRKK